MNEVPSLYMRCLNLTYLEISLFKYRYCALYLILTDRFDLNFLHQHLWLGMYIFSAKSDAVLCV